MQPARAILRDQIIRFSSVNAFQAGQSAIPRGEYRDSETATVYVHPIDQQYFAAPAVADT